ncbi:nicotinamide-nucleotide amidohydrolase family protein [Arcanobacterium sp. S3PF19]|uniref:nicotinamide-nucleotide amidohydrolase family protein n=1 Tax=Arcanobacterium sp. S3PF19 TaxID=1219585 RepID=UPI0005573528|nr:nicotinamide-nucleotide amidohydrolase family protein [Arcanobacterium sp. S3PF19]
MRSVTEKAVGILLGSGKTVAVAESLTAGLLAAEFVCVPGVSAVFRGGVVSYATDLKISLLGVDAELAEREGVVNAPVALQMAQGAAECCGSDFALSTTGVAGPGPNEGKAAGTVFIGCVGAGLRIAREYHFSGTRNDVRKGTVKAAMELFLRELEKIRGN